MKFTEFNFDPSIQKALQDINYIEATPIQEQAIPIALEGIDLLGSAQTGTGKTAAFSLPIIELMLRERREHPARGIQTLIVTPTRELALQIDESIADYTKYTDLRHAVIFGGVSKEPQIRQLKKGVDILTATPGRLLDLMDEGYISLEHIKYLVLDEADRMLDMGFIHDIKRILKVLPNDRQSLFFSATMPKSIVKLSNEILKNPKRVSVSPTSSTAETIEQEVYFTNKTDKKGLLLEILNDSDIDQALIFSRTKHGADKIVRFLKKNKISAAAIHGNKTQPQRQKALNQFKEGKVRLLIATDIAARGIDIDRLRYVINYDIPNEPETYVHRIGRSGRAGEEGRSISISEPEENAYIRDIEKLIQQNIPVADNPKFPQTDKPMTTSEKKEYEKEKQRRKQEFFANRKKKMQQRGSKSGGSRKPHRGKKTNKSR